MSIQNYVDELDEDQLRNCIGMCQKRIQKLDKEPRMKLAIVTEDGMINEAFFPADEYDTAIKLLCHIAKKKLESGKKPVFELGINFANLRESEAQQLIDDTRKQYATFLSGVQGVQKGAAA